MESTNHKAAVSRKGKLLLGVLLLIASIPACGGPPPFNPTPTATPSPPITITVAYSTEKEDWLKKVTTNFNQKYQGQIIAKLVNAHGSLDEVNAIVNGKDETGQPFQPTIWSPASNLELNLLEERWQQAKKSGSIFYRTGDYAPGYPVSSPLVFAVWQKRSTVLSNSLYRNLTWDNIHALVQLHDWSQVDRGDSSWGRVKFGQTQPDLSNSGLMTLVLIAYSYFKTDRDLTVDKINNSPGFRTFLKDIEDEVQCFGASSGTYMDTVISRGPTNFDIITTYENLLLEKDPTAQKSRGESLMMYYPSGLEMVANHPFVVLQGNWVAPEQKQDALKYLSFLNETSQQQSALIFGLRPSALSLTANVSGNLFVNEPGIMIKLGQEPPPVPQDPSGDALEALIKLWQGLGNGDSARQC